MKSNIPDKESGVMELRPSRPSRRGVRTMLPRSPGRLWTGIGLFVTACLASAGCRSSHGTCPSCAAPAYTAFPSGPAPAAAPATAPVLGPSSVVAWSIGSGKVKSNQAMSSTKTVAADGSLDLGPYGSVKVAGLTVDQARTAVERHLTS